MRITYQILVEITSLEESDHSIVIMCVRISTGRSLIEVHTLEVNILLTKNTFHKFISFFKQRPGKQQLQVIGEEEKLTSMQ